MAKAYLVQLRKDKMIAESEEDIKSGRIHSQKEVQQIIESWKKLPVLIHRYSALRKQ
jgi:hypothetical protein